MAYHGSCVVAYTDGKKVYMASDSAIGNEDCIVIDRLGKMVKTKHLIMGICGGVRGLRAIQSSTSRFPKTKQNEKDVDYIFRLTNSLKDIIEEYDKQNAKDIPESQPKNDDVLGCEFLIGYKGRIFAIDGDFAFFEPDSPYWAIGVGGDYALGTMGILLKKKNIKGKQLLQIALETVEVYSPNVRGPVIHDFI